MSDSAPSGDDASPASVEQQRGTLPVGDMSEELFDALDDIAGVVLALRGDADHAEKAERLDQAGRQIVDTLVHEFSLKSAQVEVLLRGIDDANEAWGTYAQKVARRNEHLDEGSPVA